MPSYRIHHLKEEQICQLFDVITVVADHGDDGSAEVGRVKFKRRLNCILLEQPRGTDNGIPNSGIVILAIFKRNSKGGKSNGAYARFTLFLATFTALFYK